MAGKRILDIRRAARNEVEVEYFDMNRNSRTFNQYGSAIRKIQYPRTHSYDGAYIIWDGRKVVVEALLR